MQKYFTGYTVRAGVIGALIAIVVLLSAFNPVLGCFLGLLAWVVYLGTGILSAHWGKAADPARTIRQSAMEGAVAGGIAGGVSHVVKFIAQIVLLTFFRGAFADAPGRTGGLAFIGVECIIGAIGIAFAIILAALGAMLYTALSQPQNKPAAN